MIVASLVPKHTKVGVEAETEDYCLLLIASVYGLGVLNLFAAQVVSAVTNLIFLFLDIHFNPKFESTKYDTNQLHHDSGYVWKSKKNNKMKKKKKNDQKQIYIIRLQDM